jgi:SAM-dependent methyltransferase
MRVRRDLGDFQTPPDLVKAVLASLGPIGVRYPRVLEPTCGTGQFVAGLLEAPLPPREIVAIEIQEAHCQKARQMAAERASRATRVEVIRANLFDLDLKRDLVWHEGGPLLVIGNPPWVTSAKLGVLSRPAPLAKRNIKRLPGIEARTGASNFDLAEAVWLKLLFELADLAPTLALLCKTSVARAVLQYAQRARLGIRAASIHRIDASRCFGASVDACLLSVSLGELERSVSVAVFADLKGTRLGTTWGFARGRLVANVDVYKRSSLADGNCPRTWRQGLKHDAADVMELLGDPRSGRLRNHAGDEVAVESAWVYPLAKGADLNALPASAPLRAVIVTQQRIGQDTTHLAESAPRLWSYLQSHAARFARRKSSIYRGQPPFALFGVGPYSFSPYKVAVSGLHKSPRFRMVAARDHRPVMLDDTCYFLACESAAEAAALAALCNHPLAIDFLRSVSFPDAKRPITKKLLQCLDLGAVLAHAKREDLLARATAFLENGPEEPAALLLPPVIGRLEREFSHTRKARTV